MIQEIMKAFMFIFVAEMGDKTQILAMAFATKYPVKKVLLGIFIGAFLNHGLAVLLGNYLSQLIPINFLQIVAGFAFVGFALWTLYSGDEGEEETKKYRLGPVFTVSLAFFLGELGDKTQLTAITLAAEASYPAAVLCGTVLGMIVTGGIGIFIGKKIGDRVPEYAIKITAASVFMFFGILKLFQTVPSEFLVFPIVFVFLALIGLIVFLILHADFRKRKQGIKSGLKTSAKSLYAYYHNMNESIKEICLGEKYCGECQGNNCILGYIKTLIKAGLNEENENSENPGVDFNTVKAFNKEKLLEALIFTVNFEIENDSFNNKTINHIQKNIEIILFGNKHIKPDDLTVYLKQLRNMKRLKNN